MSRNRNQSNKRSHNAPAKPANKTVKQTSEEEVLTDKADVNAKDVTATHHAKDAVEKATAQEAQTAVAKDSMGSKESVPVSSAAPQSSDAKAQAAKSEPEAAKKTAPESAKKTDKGQGVAQNTANSPRKQQNNSAKSTMKQSKPTPTLKKAEPQQKKGGLGVALALLFGVAGTGLGAYSFNELRSLKSGTSGTQEFGAQLQDLQKKVADLSQGGQSQDLAKQFADLQAQQKALQEAEAAFKQRISDVEQMQKGLSKSVKADIDSALQARMGGVDELLAKVKDIELGQQGLSKGLSQVNAGAQAVDAADMAQQEVGYLLRMANYKLQSEGDVLGATGLLKMAESKLQGSDASYASELVDAIRAKIIQLSGVKSVDTDALIADIKLVGQKIPQLVVKSSKPQKSADDANNVGVEEEKSVLGTIGSALASGVKYTPHDPSKIDISAETVLIEKRLMQADVKSAEFAVQSRNKVLLAQNIASLQQSLAKYFANDDTAQFINKKLNAISHSELDTTLPDLSGIVKQFETATRTQ